MHLKDFDGFGNYYVTPYGAVYSTKNKGKTLKQLSQWYTTDGYLRTKLYNKSITIHRVVALTYLSNPNNLETVDHIDNNKENNYYLNLRWLSREDNAGRAGRGDYTMISPDGEIVHFNGMNEFCRENNLSQPNISKVLSGERNNHKGWKKYE